VTTSAPEIKSLHLETDAALNPAKVKKDTDGTLLTLAGGGIIVRTVGMRSVATYAVELGYVKGPHEAEAMAILRGMEIARERHQATALRVRTDNLPLVRALAGEIVPRSARFVAVLDQVREERERFEEVEFRWAPGFHGKARSDGVPSADVLARKAAGLYPR
jgi:ribonuclease HI